MAQVQGDAGSSSPLFPDRKSGVWGQSDSGYGVAGTANTGNGVQAGSKAGFGAVGTSGQSIGVFGISASDTGVAGRCDAHGSGNGVVGSGSVGVYGHCPSGEAYGVFGVSDAGTTGVLGTSSNFGVAGTTTSGDSGVGVAGFGGGGQNSTGVVGSSVAGIGVWGESSGLEPGVLGHNTSQGVGVEASSPSGVGLSVSDDAIFSGGNVVFDSTIYMNLELHAGIAYFTNVFAAELVCPLKFFQIDHPVNSREMYLRHASVESMDMKNIYDGVATLDDNGEAVVVLPEWFEALNHDFRYQLTCIGQNASVYIAEEVADNRFKIAGGSPRMKVSWQVTGIRHDAAAKAKPLIVEEYKESQERGYYVTPEAHGQPVERGLSWLRNAERRQRTAEMQEIRRRISERRRERPLSPVPPTPPSILDRGK